MKARAPEGGAAELLPIAQSATVYLGGGRRWFTLRAACRAIARQRIYARYRASGDDLENVDPATLSGEVTRRAKLYERRYRRRSRLTALGAGDAPAGTGRAG